MIQFMLQLLGALIYMYLVVSTVYLLVLALAGRWAKDVKATFNPLKKRIAILIPAFKEDTIILDTAQKAARHNYPPEFFEVIVIADSLKKDTIDQLRLVPVQVLEVHFENRTKAKSLYTGLQHVRNTGFDIILILDADNVMETNCLEKINGIINNTCKAVQCHRVAKNQNTPIAWLDAISEQININLFRRGPAAVGLSAMPLGSGMAFQSDLLIEIFDTADIVDNFAEDREIEIQLMKKKVKMEFLNDAFVYDEKVSSSGVFQKQRTRWLEAQLNQVRRFFKPDMTNAPKTALYFHVFFQTLFLPRLLYLVICCIVVLLLLVQWASGVSLFYPSYQYWVAWLATYSFVLLISIPLRFYSVKTLQAMAFIPVLMVSMLQALLKVKRNRREFLHTSKTYHDKQ